MASPSTPMVISPESQSAIIRYLTECYALQGATWQLRTKLLEADRAYQREMDRSKEQQMARAANKGGDITKLQNFTVPVVMPQVETATTYQSSVFLTGIPLFGVLADAQYMDQAMQLETIIDESATKGGWAAELIMNFRDGFKYNIAAMEVSWTRKVEASFETDINFSATQAKPKEVIWEGNKLKRMDMYNTFYDNRVLPTEVHIKGEFAGYTELFSRVALKQMFAEMPDKMVSNVRGAFESGFGGQGMRYFIPQININTSTTDMMRTGMNWMSWARIMESPDQIKYNNMYEVATLYARIIPADFKLNVPSKNTPQIWKFIIVNSQILVYAERQTNAHNYIPIIFSQPLCDGLGHQTKSLAENVTGIQEISSAMMSSVIAARRRAISDRGIYDPSRIAPEQINSINPSAKIPVKPSAYGKPLNEAYYQIPFRDDQSPEAMQQIAQLGVYADTITGQNKANQGQFVKGNKTRSEYESVMSNANGRSQMTSILLEAQMFTPIKIILKTNVIQFQGSGSVYSRSAKKTVEIDPVALRTAIMAFKVSDGLTPGDKLVNADTLAVALQQIGSSEQIAEGYNVSQLFSYLMKTQGAHIQDFEKPPEQVAYERAQKQWQQLVMQMLQANPKITQDQFPPQPVPQQFGYTPGGTNQEQVQGQQQQPGQVQQVMAS